MKKKAMEAIKQSLSEDVNREFLAYIEYMRLQILRKDMETHIEKSSEIFKQSQNASVKNSPADGQSLKN